MDRIPLLEKLILEGRAENQHTHELIYKEVRELRDEIQSLSVWKARVVGYSAGVSGVISAIAWVVSHLVSK